jgi:hypothetical protein
MQTADLFDCWTTAASAHVLSATLACHQQLSAMHREFKSSPSPSTATPSRSEGVQGKRPGSIPLAAGILRVWHFASVRAHMFQNESDLVCVQNACTAGISAIRRWKGHHSHRCTLVRPDLRDHTCPPTEPDSYQRLASPSDSAASFRTVDAGSIKPSSCGLPFSLI